MTSVKFSATVTGWDETADDIVVNVPINTPTAKFSYVVEGLKVTFTNLSEGATSYVWNFGETGATGNEITVTNKDAKEFTYSTANTYTVKLSAKDANGDVQNVYQKVITVPTP